MKQNILMTPLTVFLILSVVFLGSGWIYNARQVDILNTQIQKVQSAIHVSTSESATLDMEWAYLTTPKRIERLSQMLLPKEQFTSAKNMVHIDSIHMVGDFETVSVGNNVSLRIYTGQ